MLQKQFPSLALLSYCCPTSWHDVYSWFQPWQGSVEQDLTHLFRWSRGLVWQRSLHCISSWYIPPPFAKSCCKIATKRNHFTNSLNGIYYLVFHAPLTYFAVQVWKIGKQNYLRKICLIWDFNVCLERKKIFEDTTQLKIIKNNSSNNNLKAFRHLINTKSKFTWLSPFLYSRLQSNSNILGFSILL